MSQWIESLAELYKTHTACVLCTVSATKGSAPRNAGAKMIVTREGLHCGTLGGGRLEEVAIQCAQAGLGCNETWVEVFPLGAAVGQCCGGSVEVLFESLHSGPELFVFGAGHVGQAICKVLEATPFRVHLFDERQEWIAHPNLPKSVVRHDYEIEFELSKLQSSEKNSYAVILTHRHDLDQKVLEALLSKPFKYLGLIGSASKWERFRSRLLHKGKSEAELLRVHCPIGLPLGGGKSPQEVAISFAAEILKVHYAEVSLDEDLEQELPMEEELR